MSRLHKQNADTPQENLKVIIMSFSDQKMNKKISPFVSKLLAILESKENHKSMSWASKDVFMVTDSDDLSKNVLSKYFKHHNFSSFIRQLNIYGFEKVRTEDNNHYYHHVNFIRHSRKQLRQIQRKPRALTDHTSKPIDAGSRMQELISQLQQENQQIRRENCLLNQKIREVDEENKKQIQKIFKFLSELVYCYKKDHHEGALEHAQTYKSALSILHLDMQDAFLKEDLPKIKRDFLRALMTVNRTNEQNQQNQKSIQQDIQKSLRQQKADSQNVSKQFRNNKIFEEDDHSRSAEYNLCLNIDNFF